MQLQTARAGARVGYRCAFIAAFAGLCFAASAGAQTVQYEVRDLGSLPGGTQFQGLAINDAGDVVGTFIADNGFHGFLWHNGVMTDIGSLGHDPTRPMAINHNDQVAGSSLLGFNGEQHAFVRESGQMIDLGTLGGHFSEARGINRAGFVVGEADGHDGFQHATIWDPARHAKDLGTLGGEFSQANAINDAGLVVGWAWDGQRNHRGCLFMPDGTKIDLGDLGGHGPVAALAISNTNLIVGSAPANGKQVDHLHAFLVADGAMMDLGVLPEAGQPGPLGPELVRTQATGVNSDAIVVGNSAPGTAEPPLRPGPFVWRRGVMTNLNDLVGPGFIITEANGINDRGQIVGAALDANQNGRAVILTPIANACYANCDGSTSIPVLNVNDFLCFQSRFATGDPFADCDMSGQINVNDFICFQTRFTAGCP